MAVTQIRSAATTILGLHPTDMAEFINSQVSQRELSTTVAGLNRDLMSDDPQASALARQALDRLGFAET